MDELICSLSPEQTKKYLSLVGCEQAELNFNIEELEYTEYSGEKIQAAKSKIISSCEQIIDFQKDGPFFSTSLTAEEIEKLIPVYYTAINDISKTRNALYDEARYLSQKIAEIDKIHLKTAEKYDDFIPYKAAFGKNSNHADKICSIDNNFKTAFSKIAEHKKILINELAKISTVCDGLIPDFLENSSRAADSPRFKSFNGKEFFLALKTFIERIKNV